jgi:hypothetical protein
MEHVRYIDRTREDYIRQGYEKSYQWAHLDDVPFTPFKKPLSQSRVGLNGTSEVAVRFSQETEENPISEEDFSGAYLTPANLPTEKFYSRTNSFDRNTKLRAESASHAILFAEQRLVRPQHRLGTQRPCRRLHPHGAPKI